MYFRSFPQLTILFRALIVITTCITFGALQQTAFAKSFSCSSALALCNNQSKLGRSDGPLVGRSTLKGMSGLVGPYVTDPNAYDYYAGGLQNSTAEGAGGYFGQYVPSLGPDSGRAGEHSLAELAVEDYYGEQVVEVGWIVAPSIFRDGRPHLFVFYWVDGVGKGYNTSAFYHIPGTPQPGQRVAVDGKTHLYVIRFFQGNWWIRYDNTWIGYYPGTLWNNKANSNKFTQVSTASWFGEVAVPKPKVDPCQVQMGTGLLGDSNGSAVINDMYFVVNGTAVIAQATAIQTNASDYDVGNFTGNSFTYGGPGDTSILDCP